MYDRFYQYALTVARYHSITMAANELYVTPSTLSKSIQKLEEDFGVPLFDRVGKGLFPTYAGECFLEKAQAIVATQEQLKQQLSDIAALASGRVRLGIQLNAAPRLIPAISAFRRGYPGVELYIREDTGSALSEMLERGELDIIVADEQPDWVGRFTAFPLWESEIALILPQQHLLVSAAREDASRRYPVIDITLCENETFILPFSQQRMGAVTERLVRTYGLQKASIIRATSVDTILRLVSCGAGVTFAYAAVIQPYLTDLGLVALSFGSVAEVQCLSISFYTDRYLNDAAQRLMEMCRKAITDSSQQ